MSSRTCVVLTSLLACLIFLAAWCSLPEPQPVTPTRVPMTVLPTQTVYVFATPTMTVTPREMLPMGTRVPTRTVTTTPTPEPPTATPTINTTPPVMRG